MVNVYLPADDMTIPAFIEDLERIEDDLPWKKPLKARVVPGKQDPRPPQPPERPAPDIQYNIIKSKGIQLAFDPVLQPDGSPSAYQMVLINDTRTSWLFSLHLSFRDNVSQKQNGQLQPISYQAVGTLRFDQLNDGPVIDIDCWRVSTQGTGAKKHHTLRIKPKSFFSKQLTAPLLNRPVHLYHLFPPDDGTDNSSKTREEDIQSYTRRKVQTAQEPDYDNPFHEVVALSEFDPELDLHIEKLVSNAKKVKPNDILRIQMDHFDRYLDEAIRLGVPRVFIIHGVGTGTLREKIATRLLRIPEVKTFKNEYHARYGYGATEVIFE